MELILNSTYERDVDLVLLRAFYESSPAAQLFLTPGDEILEIRHNAMELHGESDLQVLVRRNNVTHALLIENKIDAPAQPAQYRRYRQRGKQGIEAGKWESYTVYIVAPQKYLTFNGEAGKYPNKVSYEALRNNLTDPISLAVVDAALKRSEGRLPTAVDEAVTAFWNAYCEYQHQHMPQLILYRGQEKKGPNATWPEFKIALNDAKLLHKSEKGVVDLQFRGMADNLNQLRAELAPHLDPDITVEKAGYSAVARIRVPVIDFSRPFADYLEHMETIFQAIGRLDGLAFDLSAKRQASATKNTDKTSRTRAYYLSMGFDPETAEYFARGRKLAIHVSANDDYSLILTYEDGERRRLDLKEAIFTEAPFFPLQDLAVFRRVYLGPFGIVCWDKDPNVDSEEVWDNQIDLCADDCYVDSIPLNE